MERTRVGLCTFVAICASITLACGKRSGPDVAQLSADARKLGDELDGERRRVLAQIPPAVVPRPDLGPCTVPFFQPDPNAPKDTPAPSAEIMEDLFLVERAGFASASEVATKPGPRRAMLDVELRLLDGKTSAGDVERARSLTERSWWEQDLVLIVDELELPQLLDDKTFQPGKLRGRAYVWDFAKSAIVCASMVYVESSDTVKVRLLEDGTATTAGAEYLKGDLYERGIAAGKKRLFVAGPRPD